LSFLLALRKIRKLQSENNFFIGKLPLNRNEAIRLTEQTTSYCVIDNIRYWRSTSTSLSRCLFPEESVYVLREIHEGIYDLHIGSRALAS